MFLAFCAFIAFLLYYFRHHYRAKFVNGLPQLPSLPVIGNSLEVIKSPKNFILKYGRKYPEGFIGNFLGQQSHYLHGNEGNQWIFQVFVYLFLLLHFLQDNDSLQSIYLSFLFKKKTILIYL